ncbi:hypothetical protein PIB30_113201, partial [Stylosanthes scabra]|nr:hypothetical protein [Stylosanthes scabra]
MLHYPRGVQLPDDVPPTVTQPRDQIVLPRDAPGRGRRARQQCTDIRRKGEGAPRGGRLHDQAGGEDVDEEAEYRRQEDIPDGIDVHDQCGADIAAQEADCGGGQVGDEAGGHDADIDFFTSADLDL